MVREVDGVSSHSLSGLLKWVAKDPWEPAFLAVLDRHVGPVLDDFELADFDALGGMIDPHWVMTVWGCAFEDFLTKETIGVGNIVDDYLKRRGWKETAKNRAYMSELRNSVMSLYEASDIEPGRSFLARDLIRGGEPVRVSERTATQTLKPWERLAARVVNVRGTNEISGGLLPFDHKHAELLLSAIRRLETLAASELPEAVEDLGLDGDDPELVRALALATDMTERLRNLAPVFSASFLTNVVERVLDPVIPQLVNSSGDEMEFMRVVYRRSDGVTDDQLRAALAKAPDLHAESETAWIWLPADMTSRDAGKAADPSALTYTVTTEEGSTILGTIELTSEAIELHVNSEARAELGREMLEPLLGDLVGAPLVERQTVEQALADHRDAGMSRDEASDISLEEATDIVRAAMDSHYRAQLDLPIPALGNISPRHAARSKKGRDKLVAWLKLLENQSAEHDADDPMAGYDFTWMWLELGVLHLRK